MPFALDSRLESIEKELKEIKRKIYLSDSKKRFFRSAGSWSKINTEKMKNDIYKSREVTTKKRIEF